MLNRKLAFIKIIDFIIYNKFFDQYLRYYYFVCYMYVHTNIRMYIKSIAHFGNNARHVSITLRSKPVTTDATVYVLIGKKTYIFYLSI